LLITLVVYVWPIVTVHFKIEREGDNYGMTLEWNN